MDKKPTKEESLDMTVMVLREVLMGYYKGDCIQNRFYNPLIELNRVPQQRRTGRERTYLYERQEQEMRSPHYITFASSVIMRLEHQPDTLLIYKDVMGRSEELGLIFNSIKDFMASHLGGVKTSLTTNGKQLYKDHDVTDGTNDLKIISKTEVSTDYYGDPYEYLRINSRTYRLGPDVQQFYQPVTWDTATMTTTSDVLDEHDLTEFLTTNSPF